MKHRQSSSGREDLFAGFSDLFDDDSEFEYHEDELACTSGGGDDVDVYAWIEGLQYLKGLHSRSIQRQARKLRCTFEVTNVAPDGSVEGICCVGSNKFELDVEVDCDGVGVGGGCACSQSRNSSPCQHTYRFVKYLLAELGDPQSKLRARFERTTTPAEPALVNVTPVLAELDHYLSSRPRFEVEAEEELPVFRLVWNLIRKDKGLELIPLKQRMKKRGNDWTKGQRVSLDRLRSSPELITAPADAEVVAAIRQVSTSPYGYSYGYRTEFVFDMIAALEGLAGHDRVLLNEKPLQVRRIPFGIRLVELSEGLRLMLAIPQEPGEPYMVFVYANGLVAISEEKQKLFVCPCDEGQVELTRSLIFADVTFPRERLDELQQRLDQIGQTTPVELPESLAGPLVNEETTPVVLLRSRQGGFLECGMRVRDSTGRMFLPGTGALVFSHESEQQPVQCRRDADFEISRARRIERELNLDRTHAVSPWNWRILDFEQSLALLEDMETKAATLGVDVVWDPHSVQHFRILGSVTAKGLRVQISKKRDWFGLGGTCQVGEREFQLADLLNGIQSEPADGFMEIQPGQWARITAALRRKLEKLRDAAHANRKQLQISETAAPIVQELMESQIDFESPKSWRDCLTRLDKSMQLDPTPPASFQGTLRGYQLDGYRGLRRLAEWGVGGCLADDMGRGTHRPGCDPCLRKCPAAVLPTAGPRHSSPTPAATVEHQSPDWNPS